MDASHPAPRRGEGIEMGDVCRNVREGTERDASRSADDTSGDAVRTLDEKIDRLVTTMEELNAALINERKTFCRDSQMIWDNLFRQIDLAGSRGRGLTSAVFVVLLQVIAACSAVTFGIFTALAWSDSHASRSLTHTADLIALADLCTQARIQVSMAPLLILREVVLSSKKNITSTQHLNTLCTKYAIPLESAFSAAVDSLLSSQEGNDIKHGPEHVETVIGIFIAALGFLMAVLGLGSVFYEHRKKRKQRDRTLNNES